LEAVIDSAPNLLVVTAGIQASLLHWHETKVIQDSAWDRLAQFSVHLQRLTPAESRCLIGARLRKVVAPFGEVDGVRQQLEHDDLFPLGRAWAEVFFREKIELRPREVINSARESWQREQETIRKLGGPAWLEEWGRLPAADKSGALVELTTEQFQQAIDAKIAEKVAELLEQRRQKPDTLQQNADNLAGLIGAFLKHLGGLEIDRPPQGKTTKQCPFSLVARRLVGENKEHVGILVLVNSSATSTAAALRGLINADAGPERMLLISDQRVELTFGAQPTARGREYYQKLKSMDCGQFRHVELTFEQHARLDVIHSLIGMARTGDLEIDLPGGGSRFISEEETITALGRQANGLVSELLGEW
jgi:hypothetical protein